MKKTIVVSVLSLALWGSFCSQGRAQSGAFAGKALESLNASEYTYVRIDTASNQVWVAAPRFQVKTGDLVSVSDSMAMPKYHSKALNRDFDVVYFAPAVTVNGAQPSAQSPGAGLPQGHPPVSTVDAKKSVDVSGIRKAQGGKTVAEVYQDKSKLGGQQVTVRGKVVKCNPNIMGKNWVHIRDGSGQEGSNDLLVTTQTPVKAGDTVLVSGLVAIDKDFGANYKYSVMIENAKVTVE
jgi:hypothetical protein